MLSLPVLGRSDVDAGTVHDGAYSKTRGMGGWAYFAVLDDAETDRGCGAVPLANQHRMELTA